MWLKSGVLHNLVVALPKGWSNDAAGDARQLQKKAFRVPRHSGAKEGQSCSDLTIAPAFRLGMSGNYKKGL